MYNSEKYIMECMESIINQIDDQAEIILVDDGSKDKTGEICCKIKSKKVKYFYIENHGISYARNYGIKQSKGKYISFVDSDDCWCKDTYINIKEELKKDPDLVIFEYSKKLKNKFIKKTFKENYKNKSLNYNIFKDGAVSGYVWNKVFKKELIINNELYFDDNLNFCEDLVFSSEYSRFVVPNRVVYINKVLYYYRIRKSSVSINFYINKNKTIVNAYSKLFELNKDKEYTLKIKQDYIFALRRFGIVSNPIFDEEKSIVNSLGLKLRVKYLMLKYFRKLYIKCRNTYYKLNPNIYD